MRWDKQVAEWNERARDGSVVVIRYEDLHRDRQSVLEAVATSCGIPASSRSIAAAVERGSFEAMRSEEEQHGAESYPEQLGGVAQFLRKGRVDGWKDELDPDSTKAIEKEFRPLIEALGYAQAFSEDSRGPSSIA